MAVAKQKTRMTNARKQLRAKVKKELQAEGTLPPDKKRLNRKAFAKEVLDAVYDTDFSFLEYEAYLAEGIACMTPIYQDGKIVGRVTPEHLGVLKALKIGIETKAFWDKKHSEGITSVKSKELLDEVIIPIMNL